MRSAFGRLALELRAKRGISQKDFADAMGLSLSRISNLEYMRTSVSDDVVGEYIRVLNCTGTEAHELRKRASFANGIRRNAVVGTKYPPLLTLFEQFGDRISPRAAAEIQQILERETGESVQALSFSSNRSIGTGKPPKTRPTTRPSLMPRRFAEICFLAYELRSQICGEMLRVDIGIALEKLSAANSSLDYRVLETLPAYVQGAFACIIGQPDGHEILVEERRFASALNGVHFARHVIGHELAHHYLHPELLVTDGEVFLAPQELAKNACSMIGSTNQIHQVVDTIVEVEAECFATFFLVPWTAFLKGTDLKYIADDFGEQLNEVKRYAPYFKNRAVVDSFKAVLWEKGIRKHLIFSL